MASLPLRRPVSGFTPDQRRQYDEAVARSPGTQTHRRDTDASIESMISASAVLSSQIAQLARRNVILEDPEIDQAFPNVWRLNVIDALVSQYSKSCGVLDDLGQLIGQIIGTTEDADLFAILNADYNRLELIVSRCRDLTILVETDWKTIYQRCRAIIDAKVRSRQADAPMSPPGGLRVQGRGDKLKSGRSSDGKAMARSIRCLHDALSVRLLTLADACEEGRVDEEECQAEIEDVCSQLKL
jgi:hypothetical protein